MGNLYVRSTDGSDADNGTTWALAKATLTGVAAIDAAGDKIFVSQNHAETTSGALTFAFAGTNANPVWVLCGNDGAEPPTALATTGTVTNTTSGNININGSVIVTGLAFISAKVIRANNGTAAAKQRYENCSFQTVASDSSGGVILGTGSNVVNQTELKGCTFKFGATTQNILIVGDCRIEGGSVLSGGTTPTNLFAGPGDRTAAMLLVEGFDFSNLTNTFNMVQGNSFLGAAKFVFRNCKLNASSWTGLLVSSGLAGPGVRLEMHNCDAGDTNYRLWVEEYAGNIKHETTLVRTGGYTDGVTPISHKFTPSANCSYPLIPLVGLERVRRQDTVGSSITATMSFIHDGAAALKDDQVWLRLQHLGTSGFPLSTTINDAKADVLATGVAQDADTGSAWDSLVAARGNLTAYSVGNLIKVASNPGRVFICTTAGTTGVSEASGFATAADGDSVTDTTAVFRAMWRRKANVTFTPQEKGYIHATPCVAVASPIVVYFDPKIVVT